MKRKYNNKSTELIIDYLQNDINIKLKYIFIILNIIKSNELL